MDGETGKVVDMKDYGIWEPFAVKVQTYKTAIEVWNLKLITFILTQANSDMYVNI